MTAEQKLDIRNKQITLITLEQSLRKLIIDIAKIDGVDLATHEFDLEKLEFIKHGSA